VLVVEDDADVRRFVTEFLKDMGYSAVEAGSGVAALRLLDSGIAVDVVFTDVRMPDGISGFQLALEIRRRSPNIGVVLTSGVAAFSDLAREAVGDLPILRKPFRSDDILQAIETVLNHRGARTPASTA
jgi:DNA-binding NtrC family response regulator